MDTPQEEAIVKTIAQADERIATKADIATLRIGDAMDVRFPGRPGPRHCGEAVRHPLAFRSVLSRAQNDVRLA